jgi:hypothetical protein
MRPIVNSEEYFKSIKKYLVNIILNDLNDLKKSGLSSEQYSIIDNYATEPSNSFLQAIELNVTNRLIYIMGEASENIEIFKNYNPLCEGFVINDIDIQTYQSKTNKNHYVHNVIFGAVNTTRYNTISFRAEIYQDTESMMDAWDNSINRVKNSKDVSLNDGKNALTNIYIAFIDLLNNTTCVLGQESACEYKGYNLTNLNAPSPTFNNFNLSEPKEISWLNYPSLGENTYNRQGNYDENGNIRIIDNGPSNFDILLRSFLK